jgi:hypothetical protein
LPPPFRPAGNTWSRAGTTWPFSIEAAPDVSAQVVGGLDPEQFPHVVRIITHVMQSGRVEDFEFGLDLVLDGPEARLNGR